MKFKNPEGAFYKYTKERKFRWVTIVEISIIIIVFIVCSALLFQNTISKYELDKLKLKGRMVNLGKYKLMSNISGSGKASVVFESDIGASINQWSKIRDGISAQAKVFTYDRAGFGWSESSTKETNISQAVNDLRLLLKKTGTNPPYILVGHAYGGLIMCKYAKDYPDEVLGLILIDSYTDKQIDSEEFQKNLKKDLFTKKLSMVSSYLGGMRLANKCDWLKSDENLLKYLSEDNRNLFKAQRVTSKYNKTFFSELNSLKSYKETIQINNMLGDKPVLVITTTNASEDLNKEKQRVDYQKELLGLSGKGEQIIIENCSTYVQAEKPEVIVTSISSILKKVGK